MRALAWIIEHTCAALLGRGTLALGKEHDTLLVHLRSRHLVLCCQRLLELHLLLRSLLLVCQDRMLARASALLGELLVREGRQRLLLLVRRRLHGLGVAVQDVLLRLRASRSLSRALHHRPRVLLLHEQLLLRRQDHLSLHASLCVHW